MNSIPTTKALIVDEGRVFLIKQQFDDGSIWNFPGGCVEFDERPRDAVVREVYEETGLEVEVADVFDTYTFTSSGRHYSAIVFHCVDPRGNIDLSLNPDDESITETEWVPVDETTEYRLAKGVGGVLEKARNNDDQF